METLHTDTTVPAHPMAPASTSLARRSPYEQIREITTYLDDLDKVANALCKATVLPKEMQNPANMKLVLMQGIAMGFDIVQSIRASFIIPPKRDDDVPKVGYYVDGLVALVRSSGKCRFFRIEETTSQMCRVVCARTDEPENVIHPFELTMEQAHASGLDLVHYRDRSGNLVSKIKQNWQTSPADMLNARCCGRACKRVFQDVVYGMTTPEDVEDFHTERDGAPEFVAAPPRTAKPASVAPASSSTSSPAGAAPPAADVVAEVEPEPPQVVEPEPEGSGDPAWDELVVLIAKLLGCNGADLLLPDEMRAAWGKVVAATKDRRELNGLSPAIGEANKRAGRSKACGELAAFMSKTFNDRNAEHRKAAAK